MHWSGHVRKLVHTGAQQQQPISPQHLYHHQTVVVSVCLEAALAKQSLLDKTAARPDISNSTCTRQSYMYSTLVGVECSQCMQAESRVGNSVMRDHKYTY